MSELLTCHPAGSIIAPPLNCFPLTHYVHIIKSNKHTEMLQNYISFFSVFFTALHSFKIITVYILLVQRTHYFLTMVHIIL